MKYKGRKKYSEKEAGIMLETTMQQFSANQECINYWKFMPRTQSDILIETLTKTPRDKAIKETEEQQEYLISKMGYLRQFCPDYRIKGSFGIAFTPNLPHHD